MKPLDPNLLKNKAAAPAGAAAPAPAPEAAAPPPGLSAPPGVGALWHALTRRWLLILALGGGLGAAGAAAVWYVLPAKYVAGALLHVDRAPPRGLSEASEDYTSLRANLAMWVKSDPVLEATLQKPESAELPEVRAQGKDAAAWLKAAALVDDKTAGPEALRLTVTGDRADDVAALANGWAKAAGEVYTAGEEAKIRERIKQLRQTYRETTELLRTKKNDLQTFRDRHNLEDPKSLDAKVQAEQAALQTLRTEYDKCGPAMDELAKKAEQARAQVAAPEKLAVSASAVDDEIDKDFPQNPVVKAQIDQLLVVQKDLATRLQALSADFREGDPKVIQDRKEIAEIEKTLAREREELRPDYEKRVRARTLDRLRDEAAKAEQEIQGLQARQTSLAAKRKEAEDRLNALRANGQAMGRSDPTAEGMQAEVNEMDASLKRLGEEEANLESCLPLSPRLTVMEAAATPMFPATDKKLKAAGGTFLGLFGLVFLGVAAVEFRARRVYKSDDVSQGLGLPLMGTVPTLSPAARASAPAADDPALGPAIESVDGIRTMLLHAGRSEALRVIMVGSAVSGEGKTSLACHLAASLARGGRRTLLIDADLRNPTAHRLFGLTAGPGFGELLRGEVEPGQVVQNTTLENLSLLAAGACDRRTLQALAQEGLLRTVLGELKEQYDFLIIDVSPVLPVADALLIGEHADAVLLSVLRNVSRLPAVHAAQQRLAALGIRVLGAVVIGEGMETYGRVPYPAATAAK